MKRRSFASLLLLVTCLWASDVFASSGMQRVEYIAESIVEKQGRYVRLLGGSAWILARPTLALVTADIIIVFQDVKFQNERTTRVAILYAEGDEIVAEYVDGPYVPQSGYLTTVVEALGDGAVLKLADGSLLMVPEYDRFDTGWWLPPYKALLTENRMYLYNLKKGRRVWVNPR